MAATRLIPMHLQKSRSMGQCLKERTDYAKNDEKTEAGQFVSSYECDPSTVDLEFEITKNQYAVNTGRNPKEKDVIAYQIRQSFKPGETTPEEANQIGYETENMLLLLQLMWTRHISITTLFTIPPHWMRSISIRISSCRHFR